MRTELKKLRGETDENLDQTDVRVRTDEARNG